MFLENSMPRKSVDLFFLLLCSMGLFAILSSTMSKNPVLPLFAESIATPEYLMGIVAAASTIPGILVSLPAGSLSDMFGRRKVLILSSIIFASAPFLYLLVALPWQLIIVRFYHGFATAIFVPVANAAIAERFPKRRGEKISVFSSATVVGRTIAPFLGGYILSATSSNYNHLYVSVGVAGVIALFVALTLPRKGSTKNEEESQKTIESKSFLSNWKEVIQKRGVLVTSAVEATIYYTFGAFEFFLALYAKSIGLNELLIGVIAGLQLVMVAVSKPFMGWLSDRIGRRTPIIVGLIVASVPLILTSLATSFVELTAVSVIYGLGFSLVTSSTVALVSDLTSKKLYGASMGFLSTIMDVGQTLGSIITGFILATSVGFFGAFAALGGILLVFSAFFFVITRANDMPSSCR
jgi:MFS family permease